MEAGRVGSVHHSGRIQGQIELPELPDAIGDHAIGLGGIGIVRVEGCRPAFANFVNRRDGLMKLGNLAIDAKNAGPFTCGTSGRAPADRSDGGPGYEQNLAGEPVRRECGRVNGCDGGHGNLRNGRSKRLERLRSRSLIEASGIFRFDQDGAWAFDGDGIATHAKTSRAAAQFCGLGVSVPPFCLGGICFNIAAWAVMASRTKPPQATPSFMAMSFFFCQSCFSKGSIRNSNTRADDFL